VPLGGWGGRVGGGVRVAVVGHRRGITRHNRGRRRPVTRDSPYARSRHGRRVRHVGRDRCVGRGRHHLRGPRSGRWRVPAGAQYGLPVGLRRVGPARRAHPERRQHVVGHPAGGVPGAGGGGVTERGGGGSGWRAAPAQKGHPEVRAGGKYPGSARIGVVGHVGVVGTAVAGHGGVSQDLHVLGAGK